MCINDTGEVTLYIHCSGLLENRSLQVSTKEYSGNGLEMAGHLVVTLGETLYMVNVEVSWNRGL